jgi:hypothetical protein
MAGVLLTMISAQVSTARAVPWAVWLVGIAIVVGVWWRTKDLLAVRQPSNDGSS